MSIETFEDLAKKITYDRMLHFGYTPEQIAEAEAEDHSRCDWNADERNCLGEDEKSLHPIADELDATAESVVWVLEYVMRPVAEIRARLSEVEAERDALRMHRDEVWQRIDRWSDDPDTGLDHLLDVWASHERALAQVEAWRRVVEAAVAYRDARYTARAGAAGDHLVAAVDALPPKGGTDG